MKADWTAYRTHLINDLGIHSDIVESTPDEELPLLLDRMDEDDATSRG